MMKGHTIRDKLTNVVLYLVIINALLLGVSSNFIVHAEEVDTAADSSHVSIEESQERNANRYVTKDFIEVEEGDKVTYYLKVTSDGKVDANDVIVTGKIPQIPVPLEVIPSSISDGGALGGDGISILWKLKTMKVGEERTLSFSVTVPKIDTDETWLNSAKVNWQSEDSEDTRPSESSNEVRIGPEGLGVRVEKYHKTGDQKDFHADDNLVEPGQKVTYQLKVKNTNIDTAKNVVLIDPLPVTMDPDMTSVKVEETNGNDTGAELTEEGILKTLTFKLGDLDSGDTVEITFDVTVPETAIPESWWVNHAYLTYDNIAEETADTAQIQALGSNQNRKDHDPNFDYGISQTAYFFHSMIPKDANTKQYKYTADVREYIVGPQLVLDKKQRINNGEQTQDFLAIASNDTVTYYVTVTNIGSATAKDVVITDPIPEGLTLIDGSIQNGGLLDNKTDTIAWHIGDLELDESLTASFSCLVPQIGDENVEFRNTAYATYDDSPHEATSTPSNEVVIGALPAEVSNTPVGNNTDTNNDSNDTNNNSNNENNNDRNDNNGGSNNGNSRNSTRVSRVTSSQSPSGLTRLNNYSTTSDDYSDEYSDLYDDGSSSTSLESPKTGIVSSVLGWGALLGLSSVGFIGAQFTPKRKKDDDNSDDRNSWLDI